MAHVPKLPCIVSLGFGEDSPPPTPGLRVELDQTKPVEEFLPPSSHTYKLRGAKWFELALSQLGMGPPIWWRREKKTFISSRCKRESI